MRKIPIIVITWLLTSTATSAEESGYKYCAFAGYFGVNSFMGGLASQIVSNHGLLGNSACQAAWKRGYEVGQRAQHGNVTAKDEVLLMLEAGEFSAKVNNFIIKAANL
jgi:hypothetical protein